MRYKVGIMTSPVIYTAWTKQQWKWWNTKSKLRYKVEIIKNINPNYEIKRRHYEIKA